MLHIYAAILRAETMIRHGVRRFPHVMIAATVSTAALTAHAATRPDFLPGSNDLVIVFNDPSVYDNSQSTAIWGLYLGQPGVDQIREITDKYLINERWDTEEIAFDKFTQSLATQSEHAFGEQRLRSDPIIFFGLFVYYLENFEHFEQQSRMHRLIARELIYSASLASPLYPNLCRLVYANLPDTVIKSCAEILSDSINSVPFSTIYNFLILLPDGKRQILLREYLLFPVGENTAAISFLIALRGLATPAEKVPSLMNQLGTKSHMNENNLDVESAYTTEQYLRLLARLDERDPYTILLQELVNNYLFYLQTDGGQVSSKLADDTVRSIVSAISAITQQSENTLSILVDVSVLMAFYSPAHARRVCDNDGGLLCDQIKFWTTHSSN